MASESSGREDNKATGHRNHFQLLAEGRSWSGREPNTLFQNRGNATFDEVGNVLGVYSRLDARGAAPADLDGDGDLDLVVYNRNNPILRVLRNDAPGQGNLALVELVSPMSVGAQAVVRCGEKEMLRQVAIGSGFLSQAPTTLHFGLGGCREIDEIEVTWLDGESDVWHDLPVDHRLRLEKGNPAVSATALAARNYNRDELELDKGQLSAPRPDLSLPRLEGGHLSLAELDASTVVLNFWATWCTACLAEMPDLEALHRRFSPRGLRVYGIAMDAGQPRESVDTFLEEVGVTYEQLWGSLTDQQPFSSLASSPPGAIPMTVIMHRGTIRDVEVGRIDVPQVTMMLESLLGE